MADRPERIGQGIIPQIILVWCALLLAAYGVTAYFVASTMSSEKAVAIHLHEARLSTSSNEAGRTEPETRPVDLGRAPENIKVETGIYIDRISEFSIKDSRWTVEFFIWFRWVGKGVSPGETIHIVNGEIIAKQLEDTFEDGEQRYALYHVRAKVTKFFDVTRFPRDDHLMTIRFEDSARQFYDLVYVPDRTGSTVSSHANIPGYEIIGSGLLEKKFSYKTSRGDPRLPEGYKSTFSHLVYGISIKRPSWSTHINVFLGIFASVAIAFLAFFINPEQSGPKIVMGVGAFFAAVGSTYVISSQVPQSNEMGLVEVITGVSLITIFLTLLTSALSIHIYTRLSMPAQSQRLERMAQIIFVAGYVIFNVVVARAASI